MDTIYKALRDYIGAAVVSAWSIDWYKDGQEVPDTDYAVLSLASSPESSGMERLETYARSEVWGLRFAVGAKFSKPALPTSIDDFLIEKAASLRTEIYSDNSMNSSGYLPNVESVDFEEEEGADTVRLLVVVSCRTEINR